jgi:hypothetical protein
MWRPCPSVPASVRNLVAATNLGWIFLKFSVGILCKTSGKDEFRGNRLSDHHTFRKGVCKWIFIIHYLLAYVGEIRYILPVGCVETIAGTRDVSGFEPYLRYLLSDLGEIWYEGSARSAVGR